MPEMFAVDL